MRDKSVTRNLTKSPHINQTSYILCKIYEYIQLLVEIKIMSPDVTGEISAKVGNKQFTIYN